MRPDARSNEAGALFLAQDRFSKKREDAVLPKDTLERISYILGIYKALQILPPEPTAADEWVRKPNEAPDDAAAGSVSVR